MIAKIFTSLLQQMGYIQSYTNNSGSSTRFADIVNTNKNLAKNCVYAQQLHPFSKGKLIVAIP
jgi:hypothetical protein